MAHNRVPASVVRALPSGGFCPGRLHLVGAAEQPQGQGGLEQQVAQHQGAQDLHRAVEVARREEHVHAGSNRQEGVQPQGCSTEVRLDSNRHGNSAGISEGVGFDLTCVGVQWNCSAEKNASLTTTLQDSSICTL